MMKFHLIVFFVFCFLCLEGPVLSQPMNPLANLPFGGMATSASNAATGAMNGMLGGVMTRVKRSDPTEEQLECAAAKKEVCAYYSTRGCPDGYKFQNTVTGVCASAFGLTSFKSACVRANSSCDGSPIVQH